MDMISDWREEAFYSEETFLSYFADCKLGVLDIETTGLSPSSARAVLTGLATPEAGGLALRQFFSDSRDTEAALLAATAEALADWDVVITYNGDHFDLPFLRGRADLHRVPFPEDFLSLDLYRVFHRHSRFRESLPNLKQKTVECFADLAEDRADEIDGRESVELYYAYCRNRDPALKEKILLHNKDDVLQLSRLLCLLGRLDLHKIMFCTGFPVAYGEGRLFLRQITVKDGRLSARGFSKALPADYHVYEDSYLFRHRAATASFLLEFPLLEEAGYSFVDLAALPPALAPLADSPACHSGYLLLAEGKDVYYDVANRLLQLSIKEILKNLQEDIL